MHDIDLSRYGIFNIVKTSNYENNCLFLILKKNKEYLIDSKYIHFIKGNKQKANISKYINNPDSEDKIKEIYNFIFKYNLKGNILHSELKSKMLEFLNNKNNIKYLSLNKYLKNNMLLNIL